MQLSNFTIERSLLRPKVCLIETQKAESEVSIVKGGRMGKKVGRQIYMPSRLGLEKMGFPIPRSIGISRPLTLISQIFACQKKENQRETFALESNDAN